MNAEWLFKMNELNPIQLYVVAVYLFKSILLFIWIVFYINGHQVSKRKSSEFLANLEKKLANSSDFLGAN